MKDCIAFLSSGWVLSWVFMVLVCPQIEEPVFEAQGLSKS